MENAVADILHLEDSDLDAELIRDRLERSGLALRVRQVSERTGFEESLRSQPFDLILSDYQVPSFNGHEALQLAMRLQPGAPFIFISGALGEEVAIETLRDGATDYVLKSRLGRLVPAIERALRESRERDRQMRDQGRLRILWEAASALLSHDNPKAMLGELLGRIAEELDAEIWLNHLLSESGLELRLEAGSPHSSDAFRKVSVETRPWHDVIADREPIVLSNLRPGDGFPFLESLGIRSFVCQPLCAGHRLFGALAFASRIGERFESDDLAFIETISRYVSIAYDRRHLVAELRAADRRKDEFLATLAHELRNPLAPVRNGLQLIKLSNDRAVRDRARNMMERQLAHMVRLIDDLLDVSRITLGKLELQTERVDLNAIVEQAVETARIHMGSKHELHASLPNRPFHMQGDPIRLAQIYSNLLNNAVKYTPPGGTIHASLEADGGSAVFRVRDTGIGIAPSMLPRVFELFTQVDSSLERSQGGLGIGLTLVKRLVELHNGMVTAASGGLGRGSEFTVRFPLAGADAGPCHPSRPSALRPASRRRILVVDDNRDGADTLAEMLRLNGHEVRTAYDGRDGLHAAEKMVPEVMLLDIGLPELNGHEVAKRVRAAEWGREVIVIAVTGWGQEDDKRRSLDAGCDLHMVKPVSPTDLDKVLDGLERRKPAAD